MKNYAENCMKIKRKNQFKFLPFLCDYYKLCHDKQYNPEVDKIVSTFIPRMSRFKNLKHITWYGLQGVIKEHLINDFNQNFFHLTEDEFYQLMGEFRETLAHSLGEDTYNYIDIKKFMDLYRLGYLPIEIRALPEGTRVPMKVPVFEIISEGQFAWVGNFLETYLSTELWYPTTVATIAAEYAQIEYNYLKRFDTMYGVKDSVINHGVISEFGARGNTSFESGLTASTAWMTSHAKTSNVAANMYMTEYYYAAPKDFAAGMISTEHSVMCSNYAIDGDEITFLRKLITEIYPTGNVSVVCDSYDYWNVVDNLLPQLKDEIMNRSGILFIRGDSGSPVEIVTETVERLWNIFGGTTDANGRRLLHKSIRATYADSITIKRAKEIFAILDKKGFDIRCISLGAGSFSMLCLEEDDGRLNPFTRDSFGFALKTTVIRFRGESIPVEKKPATDKDNFKASYKGRVAVFEDEDGELYAEDGYECDECPDGNLLKPIFKNGRLLSETSLAEIRERIQKYLK